MKSFLLSRRLLTAALCLTAGTAVAAPNVTGRPGTDRKALLRTAANCNPAAAAVDLDINNVRARLMTGGDMWWDPGTSEPRYEVPKGTKRNSLFAGALWVGGIDAQNVLRVAAQTYRQSGNDYWPGPLDLTNGTDATECTEWDRFWKINKADLNQFREIVRTTGAAPTGPQYADINGWPAVGNGNATGVSGNPLGRLDPVNAGGRDYAPFVDVDKDGKYNPSKGDYPGYPDRKNTDLPGDQFIWWVYNDAGSIKQESSTPSIGLEIQASAFAFSTKDFMNDATFYNYRLINRGTTALDSCFVATWTDADLGFYNDDYIGCDTLRDLGILYNGRSTDGSGQVNSYGSKPPMIAVDFFIGPQRRRTLTGPNGDTTIVDTLGLSIFNWYNNDFGPYGNPQGGVQIYNIMTGRSRFGQPLHNDYAGPGIPSTGFGNGPDTKFVFPGNPDNPTEWSECASGNTPADRRFVHSAGPFRLDAGGKTNDITIGAVWVSDGGGCPVASFKKIRSADDQAQDLFDLGFRLVEGPQAPRLVIREMDRKLIMYLINDSISNNFQEQYGKVLPTDTAGKYRVATAKSRRFTDSLYKFEGYRVFQLRNSQISASGIFKEDGTVNTADAVEVFQTDIRNGITRIVNYTNARDISDTTWVPAVKVTGKDSGLRHSFVVTQDAFAKGSDKRLVNYRNYYFVAVAYAYNNFANFDPRRPDSTQDLPYIDSRNAAGGAANPVVVGLPNPANGDMGTYLPADYNTGVIIKRIEGTGNGGNDLQMDAISEMQAISAPNYHAFQPTYEPGRGPVTVTVVDPRKVKPLDWQLYITGTTNATDASRGVVANTAFWTLVSSNNDTIHSERKLDVLNDQILEKYGLSVAVAQQVRPGDDQVNGNGLITSSVTFADEGIIWLSGTHDGEQRSFLNWIRSGKFKYEVPAGQVDPCIYDDHIGGVANADSNQYYENLLNNNSATTGTWAPYGLAAWDPNATCDLNYGMAQSAVNSISNIHSVDVVFTADKSKWTRVPVLEMQISPVLAERNAAKFTLRGHRSWNDTSGSEVRYSTAAGDTGMSWFPGYAINQETGERLNMMFGEDSWLKAHNGADMLWNPSANVLDDNGNVVHAGKHTIYVLPTKYDMGQSTVTTLQTGTILTRNNLFRSIMWIGVPAVNPGYSMKGLAEGFIPTETRLRFRVTRPYAQYKPDPAQTLVNNGFPLYTFTTRDIAPRTLTASDNPHTNQGLLDSMHAVPNPYYGYTGYENNRLDTRVRIINMPRKATINIYSMDGTLIRRLAKDNDQPYIDWDIRNQKGLPIASGMYLIHVNAEGIGETVIRWFGSMRPIDATTF